MTPTLPQSHSQITQRVVANQAQAEIDYREINNGKDDDEQQASVERVDTYMNNFDTV